MKGWLHCLLTNCPEIAIQHLQDWVLYQTRLCDAGAGSQRPETPSSMVGRGFSRRGCVTKRGGVARKSVTDVDGVAAASAAVAAAADTAASETGAGRSLGSDGAVELREGRGASGSVTSGGGSKADGGGGGGARAHGGDRFGATKNTRVPATGSTAATPLAGSTLLEFFPKTAVAVAAAAGTEVVTVVGADGTDVSAQGAVDRLTPTRQPVSPSSVTDLMCIEVDRKSAGEGGRGVHVVSDAGASMGDEEPEPSRRGEGDLHIESPSKVAGSLR